MILKDEYQVTILLGEWYNQPAIFPLQGSGEQHRLNFRVYRMF